MAKQKKKICEVCKIKTIWSYSGDSICNPCNNALAQHEETARYVSSYIYGLTNKCRKCKSPLNPSRRFNCSDCSLETDIEDLLTSRAPRVNLGIGDYLSDNAYEEHVG